MSGRLNLLRGAVGKRAGAALLAGGIAIAAVATLAATSGASTRSPTRVPTVRVAQGVVRGSTDGAVERWLGIPYAAPPVGALRWRPPAPAAKWKGVRSAAQFGSNCPQPATPFGLASTNEDCLYLNVYAPAHQHVKGLLPVLVWFHGGGYWIGEGNDYDPTQLAEDGAIVVTVNYRLGALGFLAHPALADGRSGSSGNYGLMDQQAALRWVKRNIGGFGGNSRNVTIGGESAGGLAVLAQLASPGARGLFNRAIVQSGDFALTQTPLAQAEVAGKAFAAKAGCTDQTAACLRSLPVSKILTDQGSAGFIPGVVDGTVLKRSIASALASGRFNRVPIISGTNHDEERLFVAIGLSINSGHTVALPGPVTTASYESTIASAIGVSKTVAASIAARYPVSDYSSAAAAFSALDTDANFACPALQADKWTSRYVPTFAYEFNDANAPERFLPAVDGFPYGAAHESELQYLFGLPTAEVPGVLSASQEGLAASMKQYWTRFAAEGNPASTREPAWPAFTAAGQRMLSLNTPRPKPEGGFAAEHRCAFWSRIS